MSVTRSDRLTQEAFNGDESVYILGINSAYHEPAACLIRNGRIVAAVEEERFNRIRHGKPANLQNPHEIPVKSIRSCLRQAGITGQQIDHIGFSFVPELRLRHNVGLQEPVSPGTAGSPEAEERFAELLHSVPNVLGELLGCDVTERFHWLEHHVCHAASAFFVSPFEKAAVLSVDGIGEATSTWFGAGRGTRLETLRELPYPASLGLLWTKMSRFLGFGEYGQWKVMGLGGYGNPDRFYGALCSFVTFDDEGNLSIDPRILQLRVDRYDEFEKLFGPRRLEGDHVTERDQDLAAALQQLTDEVILAFARFLHRETGLRNLAMAGGVALNCVTNRLLVEEGPFEDVFIQPAANDAGTALGACYQIWNDLLAKPRGPALGHVYLGPGLDAVATGVVIGGVDAEVEDLGPHAPRKAAELLAHGEIVGWFQGRMEFGPRALGNRSILADPRRAEMVHLINDKVKHREFFRPFAASVLTEDASDWFHLDKRSATDPYMLVARQVRDERLGEIPAVTHVDGTCRLQTVDSESNTAYHQLIQEFQAITGVPLILNTSFNDREPIICTPEDALETCRRAGIRYLFLGSTLVDFGSEDLTEQERELFIGRVISALGSVVEVPVMRPFLSR